MSAYDLVNKLRAIERGPITAKTRCTCGLTVAIGTDGSCPKNPGPMAIGYHIDIADGEEKSLRIPFGCKLGGGTNNRAEYLALIFALRHALRMGVTHAIIRSDSQLMVNQLVGGWKVNGLMKDLHEEASGLLDMLVEFELRHVPREENTAADHLSKHPTSDPLDQVTAVEVAFQKRTRKFTRREAAMIRWWWATGRCRNEYRLARIFGGTPSHLGRIGRGEQYKDIIGLDLRG